MINIFKKKKYIKKSKSFLFFFFFLLNREGEKKWEEMFSFCADVCIFISGAFHTCQFHRQRTEFKPWTWGSELSKRRKAYMLGCWPLGLPFQRRILLMVGHFRETARATSLSNKCSCPQTEIDTGNLKEIYKGMGGTHRIHIRAGDPV